MSRARRFTSNARVRTLRHWARRLHLYAALITFSSFLLLGASGLTAFLHHTRSDSGIRSKQVRTAPFRAPKGMSDVDVANRVRTEFAFPLTFEIGEDALRRDAEGNLAFTFHHVNGNYQVTVLEESEEVRIVERRFGFPAFIVRAHSTLLRPSQPGLDWRVLLLSIYMGTTLVLLAVLVPTGLAIWLAKRPDHRIARLCLAASAGLFTALWAIV